MGKKKKKSKKKVRKKGKKKRRKLAEEESIMVAELVEEPEEEAPVEEPEPVTVTAEEPGRREEIRRLMGGIVERVGRHQEAGHDAENINTLIEYLKGINRDEHANLQKVLDKKDDQLKFEILRNVHNMLIKQYTKEEVEIFEKEWVEKRKRELSEKRLNKATEYMRGVFDLVSFVETNHHLHEDEKFKKEIKNAFRRITKIPEKRKRVLEHAMRRMPE